MKFKLKQPTKYMHEGLQNEDSASSNQQQSQNRQASQNANVDKQGSTKYKKKKIIKRKNEPSATRHNKINQTFSNIYHNSSKLFLDLDIDQSQLQALTQLKVREKCLCNKNTKFYCLKCMHKVCKQPFPSVQLPFQVSVIHHESQKINKSSAIPLQFLTNQVKLYSFSSLEQSTNQKLWSQLPKPGKNLFILFPHKSSKLIEQIFTDSKDKQEKIIQHLIILDCTWFQTDQILQILKHKGYNQYVRIEGYKSIYWRYNHHNEQALCSAQSLAFFMRQYQKSLLKLKPQHQNTLESSLAAQKSPQKQIKKYDNLLFLYCLNLKMILKDEELRIQSKDNVQSEKLEKQ